MRFILIPFLWLLNVSVEAQSTRLSAATTAAINVIQKDLTANRNIPSQKITNWYPIHKHKGVYYVSAMGKANHGFSKSVLAESHIYCGAQVGSVVTLQIPLTLFKTGLTIPGVDYLEIDEKIEPFLNGALVDTRADSVHAGINLPQPFTGKNILVGIADWGFDYTHPTFYDTTLTQNRIVAAWDQTKIIGTPPSGFLYGAVYTDTAQLTAAQSDTFSTSSDYHGTHVAGIAGGSGGGTVYRGIGFESDLLFSQMKSGASSSIDAFQWMYNVAKAQGKRLIINNSWGGYRTQPLDGTSLTSQAINSFSDSGVVMVFSAANNGGVNFHLKKTFNNDSVRTRISGFQYTTDTLLWGQSITMWGDVGNNFSAQLRVLNSSNVLLNQSLLYNSGIGPFSVDTFMMAGADTVWYKFTIESAHALNGRPQITMDVKCLNPAYRCILYSEANTGTVHYWNTRLTIFGSGNWGYAFASVGTGYSIGDKLYGVGHPGITTQAITIAAHNTNAGIASFSSYGPRMDELMKPDISAPGANIRSAFNSFSVAAATPVASVVFNNKTYEFIALSGTSMSGPMVTGGVSLLLEANPWMQPWHAKMFLMNTARTDNFTGIIPAGGSTRWGMGKMDLYDAMQAVMAAGISAEQPNSFLIYPNPTNGQLFVIGEMRGDETFTLVTLDGKQVMQGPMTMVLDVSALGSGMYLLNIQSGTTSQVFRVVKE